MDPRYAGFIWTCFGITALAVLWNVFAPRIERNKLKARLSESAEESTDQDV